MPCCLAARGDPGRQVPAGERTRLPDRHAGAGAPAADAAPARPRRGLNTAGFISGYRGSPLGGFDQALWQAKRCSRSATSIPARRQRGPGGDRDVGHAADPADPARSYDGVFGMWYGKGPGVDRSRRRAQARQLAGASPHGGVLALAGDDHGRSSTMAHQSEPPSSPRHAGAPRRQCAGVPRLGLYGLALSRFPGCGSASRCLSDTVDSAASVDVDPHRVVVRTRPFRAAAGGLHIRWPDDWLGQERRPSRCKHPRGAGVRARQRARPPRCGPPRRAPRHRDRRQGVPRRPPGARRLGIDDAEPPRLGLAIYKVGMAWPLEPEGATAFAEGLARCSSSRRSGRSSRTSSRSALQLRRPTAARVSSARPTSAAQACSSDGELDALRASSAHRRALVGPAGSAPAPAQRSRRCSAAPAGGAQRGRARAACPTSAPAARTTPRPRCPTARRARRHRLPLAGASDGAPHHDLHPDGRRGRDWVGASRFTDMPHVFQNMGDGTYFHSGYLAIRQASPPTSTSPTRSSKRRRRDDRRPAARRHVACRGRSPAGRGRGREPHRVVSDDPDKYPVGANSRPA